MSHTTCPKEYNCYHTNAVVNWRRRVC